MKNIETKRLFLREWQESDAQDLYNICLDMELQRSGISTYNSVEESLNTIQIWKYKEAMRAIVSKEDGSLIGLICLGEMNRYPQYKELEYAISNKYRNNGYASEALIGMLNYAFSELDILVIAAWVRSYNVKCVRVLEKCSFIHEGTLRRHARDRGDTLCYSILREEWERFYHIPLSHSDDDKANNDKLDRIVLMSEVICQKATESDKECTCSRILTANCSVS